MKLRLLLSLISLLLSVSGLTGCSSHVQVTKRMPSSINDVGLVGPNSEVILYYNDGDYIIIKVCAPNTVLGVTPSQARSNCQGKTSKVSIDSFKQAIRDLVSIDRLNVLKPLTAEEVQAYLDGGPTSEEIEAMVAELEKINLFIATYGTKDANLVRKKELVMALRSQETRINAMKKINSEIENAVNLIASQTKVTLVKYSSSQDRFLYTALDRFNPTKKTTCGLKGSVYRRIKDCSYQIGSQKEGFVLVTRSKRFKEIYKETRTGLLWSERLPMVSNQVEADENCWLHSSQVDGLPNFRWRLPTLSEYREAELNGIRKVFSDMDYFFWTTGVHSDFRDRAWLFYGADGGIAHANRTLDKHSIRCVAREI